MAVGLVFSITISLVFSELEIWFEKWDILAISLPIVQLHLKRAKQLDFISQRLLY